MAHRALHRQGGATALPIGRGAHTQQGNQRNRQYRDQIYTITNTAVPFSAAYAPGVTDSGLAARYAHDNMVSDCVRNTGTETDRSTTYDKEPATTTPP